MTHNAFYAPDTRPLIDRIWSRLGFGTCRAEAPMDLDGWAPAYMVTGTRIQLDWRDRLRILVSGKAMVDIATKTDVIVKRMHSVSAFSVLPPNAPVQAVSECAHPRQRPQVLHGLWGKPTIVWVCKDCGADVHDCIAGLSRPEVEAQ